MKELYLDTNVVLRYLLGDIPDQFKEAKKIIEAIENGDTTGFLSILVINELIWILEKYYHLKRNVYIPKLLKLFLIDRIKIMEVKKDILTKILERMQKQKIDFTDLYLAHSAPKQQIVSFDEDLKKYLSRV